MNAEKELQRIAQACADNGVGDTDDIPLADVVRGALSQFRSQIQSLETAREFAYAEIRELKRQLAAPLSGVSQAPEQPKTITVVVNGQPVTVNAGPIRAVIEAAVKASGQIGAPVEQWELRTRDGEVIPQSLPEEWELSGGTLLFMNLGLPPTGVSQAPPPQEKR